MKPPDQKTVLRNIKIVERLLKGEPFVKVTSEYELSAGTGNDILQRIFRQLRNPDRLKVEDDPDASATKLSTLRPHAAFWLERLALYREEITTPKPSL